MEAESTLVEAPNGSVILARSEEGCALVVVNDVDRVRLPLSRGQADRLALAGPDGGAAQEIERKYWVPQLPPALEGQPQQRLRQGYLVITEDASLRIREKGGGSKLTIKKGKGVARAEIELDISDAQAALLWPLAGGRIIDKTRYVLPDDTGELELDVYHGRHEGLIMLEREFPSADAARSWSPPDWAGPELTDDPRFTNAQLAIAQALPEPPTP